MLTFGVISSGNKSVSTTSLSSLFRPQNNGPTFSRKTFLLLPSTTSAVSLESEIFRDHSDPAQLFAMPQLELGRGDAVSRRPSILEGLLGTAGTPVSILLTSARQPRLSGPPESTPSVLLSTSTYFGTSQVLPQGAQALLRYLPVLGVPRITVCPFTTVSVHTKPGCTTSEVQVPRTHWPVRANTRPY
jgi:hypothetical protein